MRAKVLPAKRLAALGSTSTMPWIYARKAALCRFIHSTARLRRLAALLLAQPTDKSTLAEWARRIGMSERSMTRQSLEEMGMSVGRWRRQLHVILALQGLARGRSVKTVALELGYENTSGFVTMFRKAVGKPPARYLAERESARA
jgi:AraC-like DNA-binding protein